MRHPAYGWTGLAMMLTGLCVIATNNLPSHLDAARVWTANAALGGSVPLFAISHFAVNRYLASKAPSRLLDLIGWWAPALIAVAALASAYWPNLDAVPPDQAGFKPVLQEGPAYMPTLAVSAATAVTYLILLRIRLRPSVQARFRGAAKAWADLEVSAGSTVVFAAIRARGASVTAADPYPSETFWYQFADHR